jgi:hypothetical protein
MTHPRDCDPTNYGLALAYLRMPRTYVDEIGRVRWSDRFDGLVYDGGVELLTYEELAEFLEGYVSQEPLVSFGFLLHWLVLLCARNAVHPEQARLHASFEQERWPWRNAGAFAACLGKDLPGPAASPPIDMICHRLRDQLFPISWYSGAFNGSFPRGEEPPLAPSVFESRILARLPKYSAEDLESWFRFGRGPVRHAGETLARETPPPRALGPLLAEILQRPRLAGAESYVPQMVSALSLPPRRLSRQELPLGGYADISVRGQVEQLLPSQHALEELDFLRRFAEHELLYFRREEPPANRRQQLIVLLDQGVRAWGDVRLVLAAAAVALLRQAATRKIATLVAFTSNRGDTAVPIAMSPDELGKRFEASDLTFNPGDALEGVLQRSSEFPRDIVLLTHPANVAEEDVRVAARRLGEEDRLFALTLSPRGNAELVEMRRGMPVKLRSFRVDFEPARREEAAAPVTPASETARWTGPVEPVPWPFRLGNHANIPLFDFDHEGRRLFAVTGNSLFHAWSLSSGVQETLPRPPFASWIALVGVANGFVVLGAQGKQYVLYHYNGARRECTGHRPKGLTAAPASLHYLPEYHAVILIDDARAAELRKEALATSGTPVLLGEASTDAAVPNPIVALDLATGEFSSGSNTKTRAYQAWLAFRRHNYQDRRVELGTPRVRALGVNCHFEAATGSFHFGGPGWPEVVLRPQTEGRLTLQGASVRRVQLAGATLAVEYERQKRSSLLFFQGPEGNFLRDLPLPDTQPKAESFLLSPDGSKVAIRRGVNRLEVQATNRPQKELLTKADSSVEGNELWVGDEGFAFSMGQKGLSLHVLSWKSGTAQFTYLPDGTGKPTPAFMRARTLVFGAAKATPEMLPPPLRDDRDRWLAGRSCGQAWCVLDRFGQVFVLDSSLRAVFAFTARGKSWTAWLPDGMRMGRGKLHVWPQSQDAAERMGGALLAATKGGGR